MRLLVVEHIADFPQIDHGVEGLDAIGRLESRDFSIRTEHGLQLLGRRLRRQRVESKGYFDELVRFSVVQIVGSDTRNEAGIELLDIDDGEPLSMPQQREATVEQMPVDEVARLIDEIAPLRPQIQEVGGDFLPVETEVRDFGEPFKDVKPRLSL